MKWNGQTIAKSSRSGVQWGQQIRSYVVGRGAKDLRTGVEQNLDQTLGGDIDGFLRAALANPGRIPRKAGGPEPE